jgi:glycosyltransferase involved in cell wall biosynthesis
MREGDGGYTHPVAVSRLPASRLKVLMSAYACEPGRGSEPGAGWAWARAAALRHDVWLLTRANQASMIEAALSREPSLRLHPVYLDLPARARFWKRGQRGVRTYYLIWQVLACRRARQLHEVIKFDVAHHVTFAVDSLPAGIAWVDDLPFVWGPVGGFASMQGVRWRWLGPRSYLKAVARQMATHLLRRALVARMVPRAALAVAQNHDVATVLSKASIPVVVEPNVALEPADPSIESISLMPDGRWHAVYAGRLELFKGPGLAVTAISRPEADGWMLHLYGEGGDKRVIERLARRLGVAHRVIFHGHRPRTEVLAALRRAHALLFPSLHDSAGWSVGEAVSVGCPVVCIDRAGPSTIVRSGEGVKVALVGDVASGIARALSSLDGRIAPSRRWDAARLPELLTTWYQEARRTHLTRRWGAET